jgi:hypothetical protein
MKIIAVIALRNEAAYVANLLRHLIKNGIEFVLLDNSSSDDTVSIATGTEFMPHLVRLSEIPFVEFYEWEHILKEKMNVISKIDAEWVIHLDADEIPQSNLPSETLHDAICRVDEQGYNAIDFNEFVFLPIDYEYEPNLAAGQKMRHYYFLETGAPRLMRAWKKSANLSMVESGGHFLDGINIRLFPEKFVLRHYMFRNQRHAYEKYTSRQYAPQELARGWHRPRANQSLESFRFPVSDLLCCLENESIPVFNRSQPVGQHYWIWPKAT